MKTNNTLRVTLFRVVGLLLAVLVLFSAPQVKAKASYQFTAYEGYEQGLKVAAESGKLILLDFYFDT